MLARRLPSILPPLSPRRGDRGHAHPQRRRPARRGRRSRTRGRSARRTTRSPPPGLVGGGAAAVARRGDARAPRRAVPRRALGVRPPVARGAAPAARGRPRVDRPAEPRRAVPDPLRARRRHEPLSVRARRTGLPLRRGRPPALRAPAQRPAARPHRPRRERRAPEHGGPRRRAGARPRRSCARRSSRRASARRARGVRCNAELPRRAPARGGVDHRRGAASCWTASTTAATSSARGRDRVLRVARTVADLEGAGARGRGPLCASRSPTGAGRGARPGGRMSTIDACDDCARRSWLVARLSGHLELRRAEREAIREVLALPDARLHRRARRASRRRDRRRARRRDPERAAGGLVGRRRRTPSAVHRPGYPASLLVLPDAPAVLHLHGTRSGSRTCWPAPAWRSSVRARPRPTGSRLRPAARPRALGRRGHRRQRHGARHRLRRARGRARGRRRTPIAVLACGPGRPVPRAVAAGCTSGSASGRR